MQTALNTKDTIDFNTGARTAAEEDGVDAVQTYATPTFETIRFNPFDMADFLDCMEEGFEDCELDLF